MVRFKELVDCCIERLNERMMPATKHSLLPQTPAIVASKHSIQAASPPPSLDSAAWLPNALTDVRLACGEDFSFIKRRHHCRRCGLLFCAECSSRRAIIPGSQAPVRVCDRCYGKIIVDKRRIERQRAEAEEQQRRQRPAANQEASQASGATSAESASANPSKSQPATSRRAEVYWRRHVRLDSNEAMKVHIADVTLWLGRVQ